ncbi:MAG TPA: hypothetical protein VMJ65_03300 [Solirubrobacteraceae bacterium]|nr:hypothetical protein [Solirubrobacteraceae bacterium]
MPLLVTSPKTRWVQVVVGLGSWLVFLVDLIVQRRIDPGYLRRRNGRIDLGIVLLTFPYYLISGISSGSAILLLAGSLASLFNLDAATETGHGDEAVPTEPGAERSVPSELALLQAQLREVEGRLGQLAELVLRSARRGRLANRPVQKRTVPSGPDVVRQHEDELRRQKPRCMSRTHDMIQYTRELSVCSSKQRVGAQAG